MSPILPALSDILSCPCCGSIFELRQFELICTGASCLQRYPVTAGVPILLNEQTSTFRIKEYLQPATVRRRSRFRRVARRYLPRISANFAARENYRRLRKMLLNRNAAPRVLIVGGAEPGDGLAELFGDTRITFVETDVALGSRTRIVCDGSTLPFLPASFDAVIIQAVLELVLDPAKCVAEIHRVLKPGGLVYSEMPFMQQGHGGKYDFTRLTHLGHRRLFRQFSEISSGSCAGPGTVLAWSIQQVFLSMVESEIMREAVKLGSALTLFWIKYLDYYLIRKKGALDGACGTFFLGSRMEAILSDTELLGLYRGAVPVLGVL